VCDSLIGPTFSPKKREAPRRGHCTRKTKAAPGVSGSRAFTEVSAERAGSHICRHVKKSWHPAPSCRANHRIASPVFCAAIHPTQVLTIADPQKYFWRPPTSPKSPLCLTSLVSIDMDGGPDREHLILARTSEYFSPGDATSALRHVFISGKGVREYELWRQARGEREPRDK